MDKNGREAQAPLFTGKQGKNHIQGIAVDEANGFIYYSFTTRLVKSDLNGKLLGSVEGLVGHLGCIAFCPEDGRVYGSLEFKKDGIGAGILQSIGNKKEYEDGFYIAVFNADKIDRFGMSAEADGVMTAAFLPEVLEDYAGEGTDRNGKAVPHRYGCSGIDGLCFAPKPGDIPGEKLLWVAYGVYSDLNRRDNDHQVLLCYKRDVLNALAQPLRQESMHRSGPAAPEEKYFVYTGNTEYGVQNLEYEPERGLLLMAVYPGEKPEFKNDKLYAADLRRSALSVPLKGLNETGKALTLYGSPGPEAPAPSGWQSELGAWGVHIRADGGVYLARPVTAEGENAAEIRLYAFDTERGFHPAG